MILPVSGRYIPPLIPLYACKDRRGDSHERYFLCIVRQIFQRVPCIGRALLVLDLSSWHAAMHSCCESARSLFSVVKTTSRTMKAASRQRPETLPR